MSNILAAVDFSDVTPTVLAKAGELAKALGAKVYLLHVASAEPDFVGYEVGPVYIRESVARELRKEHQQLQEYQEGLQQEGIDVTAMLVSGAPADKIVDEVEKLNADMIILGSHGHGALYDLLVGSVCKSVLKKAGCPVLVVPSRQLGD